MTILLCSPYLQLTEIVSGGINVWANNIMRYYDSIESDIELIPVSFDRRHYVSVDTNIIKRLFLGFKEYYSAILKTKHIMDEIHPDIVHIATSASFSLLKDIYLVREAQKRHIKSVVHFHFGRIPELAMKQNWEWKLIKYVVGSASQIVTMDPNSYNTLLGLPKKNIHYCPNPLSMAIINQVQQEQSMIYRIPRKILFVGHVLPTKGVYELVNSCKVLDEIELHIIGHTEKHIRSELLRIASEKENGIWLKMRGEISHKKVLREMMSSSVFVLPSYTEGFPNVILEAMACGCPIVSTKVGAIPEMLNISSGNYCGICVEPQSNDSLLNGIKKMLSDFTYASLCATRAQKRVNELFTIPVVWEQLCNIWKKA